jgi:hypothetical protein
MFLQSGVLQVARKKVLIVDENGFSRVCSALLALNGFGSECVQDASLIDLGAGLDMFGLVVTSYPYGAQVLELLRESELPLLVLSDSLNETLLGQLKKIRNSCCMVKPLDYDKFNSFVRQTLTEATN